MRIIRPLFIAALAIALTGCEKTDNKTSVPAQPQEATLFDRDFDIPAETKGHTMYDVTEYGGQLIGEVAVTRGDATLDVRVAVDGKTIFEDKGVRRTTVDEKLPAGKLSIEIGRHNDASASEPTSVSERFKMRK